MILTTTYFGPVEWYSQLYRADNVLLEACESFIKQTWRNRCVIATANGLQTLTVPVEHGGSRLIKDVRVSNHGSWRRVHWNTLQSAYSESPFFEFYSQLLPLLGEVGKRLLIIKSSPTNMVSSPTSPSSTSFSAWAQSPSSTCKIRFTSELGVELGVGLPLRYLLE